MTRSTASALTAALAAIAVLVSTAILLSVGGGDDGGIPEQRERSARPAASGQWVGTWSAAPATGEPGTRDGFADTSIRNVVHTSVGGTRARVHLSNLFGQRPLTFSSVTLAVAAAPSSPAARPDSMRTLTFQGRTSVTIPAGDKVVSDGVRLHVPAATDLLVTVHTPGTSGPVTYHPFAMQTSYLAEGQRTRETSGASYTRRSTAWRYVTAVDVWSAHVEGAVAVLGDSLTDGITSSPGANHRWTDFLATRLRTERDAPHYSVLNAGISGNRVLNDGAPLSPNNGQSALHRIERDALSLTGVEVVIIQLGLNDLLKRPHIMDPTDIVAGLEQLVARAHAHGVRAIGSTLTPFGGHPDFRPETNAVRLAVNERIRSGEIFDAVIDFDAALRDPARPNRLRPVYDSGDHLHPSDSGYRAMARAVNLDILTKRVQSAAL